MHIKQSLLRAAAAATITAVMTVGGGATAQAAMVAGDSSKASGQGAAQADAGQEKAEQNKAAAAEKKAQGSENQPEQAQATDAPAPTQGSKAQGPKAETDAPAPSQGDKAQGPKTTAKPMTANSGNAADKSENGNGHTPVTVCHALGNGGYIELTFDENALEKHLDNHGDLYPVPEGGCPAPVEVVGADKDDERATVCHLLGNGSYNLLTFDDAALPAHLEHGDHEATDEAGCATAVAGISSSDPADPAVTTATAAEKAVEKFQVLGVQSERSAAPTVLGAEATANRAPAVVAPVAGILPATGAGDYALVLFGGAGLLAAGAALLARRRLQGDS